MRCATLFLIVGIVVGIVLPYFLQDTIESMGITVPTAHSSITPTTDHEVSGPVVMWALRGVGMGFGVVAVLCLGRRRTETKGGVEGEPCAYIVNRNS